MAIASCHSQRVAKVRGLCGSCYDKWLKSVNAAYRARQMENTTEWHRRNPEKKRINYLRRKAKERANPLIRRASSLKFKYGITLEDYQRMLIQQNSGCAICSRGPGKRPLHVDHDHATNKVRGLLCHQCNWYLGTIEHDASVLPRLKAYLANAGIEYTKERIQSIEQRIALEKDTN